jgi:hypothetical protein
MGGTWLAVVLTLALLMTLAGGQDVNATGNSTQTAAWRYEYSAAAMFTGCAVAAFGVGLILYAILARTDDHWVATATLWGRMTLVGGGVACFAFGGIFFATGII